MIALAVSHPRFDSPLVRIRQNQAFGLQSYLGNDDPSRLLWRAAS